MEVRHAAAFVAVAEELHFGRAADRLGIAQPTVSRLVRGLEAELGVTLFERTSHRVTVSAAGAALLDHARALVADRDRIVVAAAEMARGGGGRLRLGTTEGMGARLTMLLDRFAAARPNVDVELYPAHTPEKVELVRRGELDLAVVREAEPVPGLRLEPLWNDALVAVLPAGHDHATRDHADPQTIDLPLLLTPRQATPGVHKKLQAVAGTAATRTLPYRGLQEALATIAASRAWTILQATTASNSPDFVVRPLPPPATLRVALAWRPTASTPLVATFAALALAARDAGAL